MPPKKARSLPHDKNTLLHPPEDHEVLVRRCKVQEVVFDAFSVNVIRLKIPIPNKPGSDSVGTQKFITRMKDTDFFQVLSMFEVAFPFASDKEKDTEQVYIEKHFPVVQDSKVKGLWVTSEVALQLAKEYDLEPYISAMKDASPDKPSESLTLSSNPAKTATGKAGKAASTPNSPEVAPEVPKRTRRSASPTKKATARQTKPKSTPAGSTAGSTRGRRKKATDGDESVSSSKAASPVVPQATIIKAEEAIDKVVEKAEEEQKPILDSIKVGQNDSAELLAAAKAQVDAATADEQSAPPTTRVKRALEIDEAEEGDEVNVKRAKVEDLEKAVWIDERRGRALLGLAIGLGASVVLPYLL